MTEESGVHPSAEEATEGINNQTAAEADLQQLLSNPHHLLINFIWYLRENYTISEIVLALHQTEQDMISPAEHNLAEQSMLKECGDILQQIEQKFGKHYNLNEGIPDGKIETEPDSVPESPD